MEFIIVYDKKTEGHPILGIHSHRFGEGELALENIQPEEDPKHCGFIVVPEEIVRNMVRIKYKTDRKGNVIQEPVVEEISKDLPAIRDTALKTHIVVFGAPIEKLVSVKNLAQKKVKAKVIDAEKGVIDVGSASGLMSVTCQVPTGESEPVIETEEPNWKWVTDKKGHIIGMELIHKPESPAAGEASS